MSRCDIIRNGGGLYRALQSSASTFLFFFNVVAMGL
jgi:hypothetical protein